MIVYLDDIRVYDVFSMNQPFGRHQSVRDLVFVNINRSIPMSGVVDDIISSVQNLRSIWLLVIRAHGNSGYVQIANGLTTATAPAFGSLAPYMTPNGRGCEIHACAVASASGVGLKKKKSSLCEPGTEGYGTGVTFLQAMASALRSPVRGAYNCQYNDRRGDYEGPFVVAQANGAVSTHDHGL